MERRLVAILAADAVGYSRLMGKNEVGTYEQLRAHRKELFEPLKDVLTNLGQVVPTTLRVPGGVESPRKGIGGRPSAEDLVCSECGHQAPNKAALASHVRSMHDTSLAELEGLPLDYECPECGRKFNRPQGMAAHRRSTHGVPGKDVHANASKGKAAKKAGG